MPHIERSAEIVRQLSKLSPGMLPEAIFEAITKSMVTPTFVVVPLVRKDARTRVVLTRRNDDDSQFAGLLHPPGKVLLATDETFDRVFERLVETELQGIDFHSAPVFVGNFLDKIPRGREISMVHYLEVVGLHHGHTSYDPASVPSDLIETDIPRVNAAIAAFELDIPASC